MLGSEIYQSGSGGKSSENVQFNAFAISFRCETLYFARQRGFSTAEIKPFDTSIKDAKSFWERCCSFLNFSTLSMTY